MRADPALGYLDLRPTPLARALHVLRLTVRDLDRPAAGEDALDPYWPANLPALRWAQDMGALKPSAEVLAVGTRQVSEAQPLVTRLRFGAGQSIYVSTDDTWRWRHGRGEAYFEQFWIQMIRMLARDRLATDRETATLRVSHRRVEREQAVVVELRLADALRESELRDAVEASVRLAEDDAGQELARLELVRDRAPEADPAAAQTNPSGKTTFRAVWRPTQLGRLRITIDDPTLADLDAQATIDVIDPNDELRQPLPDHDRLRELATLTGGQLVKLDELDELLDYVPNRARRIDDDISERLWDSPMSLVIVLTLLTIEWVGRKWMRLM
jgi:hypothetical protein